MNSVTLRYENFESNQPENYLFHDQPRMSLTAAFTRISRILPENAQVTFCMNDDGVAAELLLTAGVREPCLKYQSFSKHQSIVIRHIHAGETPRQGLGTSMIASQLSFWKEIDVRYIGLLSNRYARGFYEKLGFQLIDLLPEYDGSRQILLHPFRLDLHEPEQKARFDAACAKAKPLSDPAFRL